MNILVTGGAGFIGSNFLNLYVSRYGEHKFINLDKLTYAANPLNLNDIEGLPNYQFARADLTDYNQVDAVFSKYNPDLVFHFAAESHVDRSILGPAAFIQSNIIGTFNLLEACRKHWPKDNDAQGSAKTKAHTSSTSPTDDSADCGYQNPHGKLFIHVSTDEVYGSLGLEGLFTETTPYNPSSPYSASKAASDHLVNAYYRTYGLPAVITNCSNNYGPYQFPEKLIPLMIINALKEEVLPVYGKGENVRDWLFVEDHCPALWAVAEKGSPGQTYNIGGNCERRNIDIVNKICENLACELNKNQNNYTKLITFVPDRPGHDLRYAIDASKIKEQLGWQPAESFESGLKKTIRWYLDNQEWVENVLSGIYKDWIETNYGKRG